MQSISHKKTQDLLLISKLLDCRDNASPFTLVIDSIEQSAKPLIRQYLNRSKSTSTKVIFVSFETVKPPQGCHHIVQAIGQPPGAVHKEIVSACSAISKGLIIVDAVHHLLSEKSNVDLSQWLSTLIKPSLHLLAIYHSSIPLVRSQTMQNPYQPHPLTLIRFLATTVLTCHSLSHVIAAKAARDRSRQPPPHGLDEDEEGTIQGLGANDPRGIVIECEMRRRSGRTIELWFVLSASALPALNKKDTFAGISLLDEHPLYKAAPITTPQTQSLKDESEHGEVSFNLNLTERQKQEREGVVLPYFDAQVPGAAGEGGRILYDMGSEDDFDDEEDEI